MLILCKNCGQPLETCECDMVATVAMNDINLAKKNLTSALKQGIITWTEYLEIWRRYE